MAAPKGHEKWGGRQKGTKNDLTVLREIRAHEFRQAIGDRGVDLLERIFALLDTVSEEAALSALLQLLPYQFPKLKQVEVTQGNPFLDMDQADKIAFAEKLVERLKQKQEPKT